MNISGQVVKTSQLPKKTLGLGDSLLALINSPLETVTVPVSEFVTFVSNQIALGTYTLDTVTTAGNTTTNVINVGGVNSPYLQLNTVSPGSQAVGRFVWNDTDGTVDLRLKGNNVTLQLGQETVVRVVNKTNTNLLESEYKVVRVRIASEGGAQGQRLAVVLAQGNNDPDSVTTLGIVTEDIGNNQEGFITVFGNVSGINTTGSLQGETWADGDVLFLSPTTPGSLTKVKPVAPNHTVVMGYVVYAHQNNGKIFVKVDNGYELEELHDVLPTPYVNNGVLYRDTTANLWRSATISTLLGGTPLLTVPTLSQVTTAGNTTTNAITTGGLTVGTDLIYTDTANGRVGFGTTSPTTTLDVRTSGQGYITIGGADGRTISAFSNAGVASVVNFSSANVGGFLYANNWYDTNSNTQSIRLNTTTISLWTASTERLRIANSGNILVNTTTDAGYKLDVNGTARVQGTTTITPAADTSAIVSTGYSVTGSGTTPLIDLSGTWNTTGLPTLIKANVTGTSSANALLLDLQVAGVSQFKVFRWGAATLANGLTAFSYTASVTGGYSSGTFNAFTWGPAITSNSANYTAYLFSPNVNQTGGSTGTVRGVYINPTITTAYDFRSLEWSNNTGWGLFGVGTAPNYLGGSLVLGTTTVNASASLQVDSTTKGFLPPRMTTAQILLISSPAEGLQVYNTDLKTICFYNGTAWQRVTSTAM